jgi:hypothetical protein
MTLKRAYFQQISSIPQEELEEREPLVRNY